MERRVPSRPVAAGTVSSRAVPGVPNRAIAEKQRLGVVSAGLNCRKGAGIFDNRDFARRRK